MPRTPLAIFAFRRPNHLRELLASVAACRRLDECAVTIFCDGPRNRADAEAVKAARAVAQEWAAAHGSEVVERSENMGLARSIVTAATELVTKHGRVIAVEDDMILGPDFLDFMLGGLDRYENEERLLQISGFAFSIEPMPRADAIFLPLASTWGWATWQRAWERFRWEPENVARIEDESVKARFDLEGAYPYSTMLKSRLEGGNDSWGILWYWAVFQSDGLVLFPRESLVHVGGADDTGTHCNARHHHAGPQQPGSMRKPGNFEWPRAVVCDDAAWRAVKTHIASVKQKPGWLGKLRAKIRERAGIAATF